MKVPDGRFPVWVDCRSMVREWAGGVLAAVTETLKAKVGLNLLWSTEEMPSWELYFRRTKSGVAAEWFTARWEGGADRTRKWLWSSRHLGGV